MLLDIPGQVLPVIIEPYWNWNRHLEESQAWRVIVIIEPYWNWNFYDVQGHIIGFSVIIEPYWNWNVVTTKKVAKGGHCYNWTLLELKLSKEVLQKNLVVVIIEPYWNWNGGYSMHLAVYLSYNWTLLELKCWL